MSAALAEKLKEIEWTILGAMQKNRREIPLGALECKSSANADESNGQKVTAQINSMTTEYPQVPSSQILRTEFAGFSQGVLNQLPEQEAERAVIHGSLHCGVGVKKVSEGNTEKKKKVSTYKYVFRELLHSIRDI